jgi:hypothetical protein
MINKLLNLTFFTEEDSDLSNPKSTIANPSFQTLTTQRDARNFELKKKDLMKSRRTIDISLRR